MSKWSGINKTGQKVPDDGITFDDLATAQMKRSKINPPGTSVNPK
jgi:hypothetical protein